MKLVVLPESRSLFKSSTTNKYWQVSTYFRKKFDFYRLDLTKFPSASSGFASAPSESSRGERGRSAVTPASPDHGGYEGGNNTAPL